MTLDEIERLEQIVMSMVIQALKDYRQQAATIFRKETRNLLHNSIFCLRRR